MYCNLRVIIRCFYTGATRKGGPIWTSRPTRAHGESLCAYSLLWCEEPNFFGVHVIY